MLLLVSIAGFGQDTITMPTIKYTNSQSSVYGYDKIFQDYAIRNFSDVPKSIIYNYDQGRVCFNTGVAFISIGALFMVPGTLFSLFGSTPKSKRIGAGLLYTGSTLVSVSVPLLCFGDHIKKDANMAYEVWSSLNYKWIENE